MNPPGHIRGETQPPQNFVNVMLALLAANGLAGSIVENVVIAGEVIEFYKVFCESPFVQLGFAPASDSYYFLSHGGIDL